MIKRVLFSLLLVIALFSVIVNIAHGEELQDDHKYEFLKPPQDVQQIFDTLRAASGGAAHDIDFYVHTAPFLNAYMDSTNKLVVYVGLLNFTIRDRANIDMLAAVIGHEIGHKLWGHVSATSLCFSSPENSRDCEREADQYAVWILHTAGFDCAGDADFYRAIIDTWGDSPKTYNSTHPSDRERMLWSERACKTLKETGRLIPVEYETITGQTQSHRNPIK
jgi:predicted Zn-dependent protease